MCVCVRDSAQGIAVNAVPDGENNSNQESVVVCYMQHGQLEVLQLPIVAGISSGRHYCWK